MNENTQNSNNIISRPPIVVVMGHIDHGKTTLLDTIRKTEVAAHESGGITQHIGAYEVNHDGKQITFLDTPGHEAFGKMRSRGAKVADIAVLVVAADDGVKPQTREALGAIREAKIPYVVAINKIDKSTADVERVKNDLAHEEVFLEGRGGTIPAVEISAKAGTGIDQLFETIVLLAELENLSCNSKNFAEGVVIESHRDPKRGITSTLLVRDGTLKKNEYVVAGATLSKTRFLENFRGEAIDTAGPSTPVVVVGFDTLPPVGFEFKTFFSQKDAMAYQKVFAEKKQPLAQRASLEGEKENLVVGIVIKSDTAGSAEAIQHEIEKLKASGLEVRFLKAEAGDVSVADVSIAASAKHPIIVAFKVAVQQGASDLAERLNVVIQQCQIIYEISDFLKTKIEELLPAQIERTPLGRAKILKLFKGEAKNQVVGGRVLEGLLRKGACYAIVRRSNTIGEGKVENVQSGKMNVSEIDTGQEFGALTNSSLTLAPEDVLELFEEQITKRKL